MTRLRWAMATFVATSAIAGSTWIDAPTKLIWNASASTPIGFYTVEPTGRLEVTDLVAVDAPNRSPASWRTVDICRAGHRC